MPLAPAVYIVGAGPGDPDLLTLRAHKLLAQADVILFADSLVPEAVLQDVRTDVELIPSAARTLEEIVPLMVQRVQAGKSVVRLHSGDPSLYGAVQEQMEALLEAGVPFEVVPGISAFQLAAARLRVELTVPEQVQSIILTRISGRTQVPEAEELSSLAAHQASLCLYLSARHVAAAQAKLMLHYGATTPVAICFRLGWGDEKIRLVPLAEMAQVTVAENFLRTTLYVISPVLAARTVPPEFWGDRGDSGETGLAAETVADGEESPGRRPAKQRRSHLYRPDYPRLFRPSIRP